MSGSKGSVLDKSDLQTAPKPKESKQWALVLWNNDVTPFDVVIDVLSRGLGIDVLDAHNMMMEAHTHEYCVIQKASRSVCEVKLQIAQVYCQEAHLENPMLRYNYLRFSIEEA